MSSYHPIAEDDLLVKSELRRAMCNKGVELDEGCRIQEQIQPLACCQLAAPMLQLDALGAAAEQGLGPHCTQALNPFVVRRHRPLQWCLCARTGAMIRPGQSATSPCARRSFRS